LEDDYMIHLSRQIFHQLSH